MGDATSDETVQGKMVQTDAECKRNSVISSKPKPPLPKKPPVAVKPKLLNRSDSEDKGLPVSPKAPPPLPKTPPKGSGGTAVKNAESVRSSASPDRSHNLTSHLSNHLTESCNDTHDSSNHLPEQPSSALLLKNHATESNVTALSSHMVDVTVENVTCTDNFTTPYHTRSQTLERAKSDQENCPSYLEEQFHTLPKTPPKISPKPVKKPPNVLPKPRISKKNSESDLQSDILNLSSDSEKSIVMNNNDLDSSINLQVTNGDFCKCDTTVSNSDLTSDKQLDERKIVSQRENVSKTLDLELQNGHSRPPPVKLNLLCSDSKDGGIDLVSKQDNATNRTVDCDNMDNNSKMHNRLEIIDRSNTNLNGDKNSQNSAYVHETVMSTSFSCTADVTDSNVHQTNNVQLLINDNVTDSYLQQSYRHSKIENSEDNLPKFKENGDGCSPTVQLRNKSFHKQEKIFDEESDQKSTTPKLSVPSPAPRKSSPKSPRPRPTPRKRLSLSKSCEKIDLVNEYTDCMSAKTTIAQSESVGNSGSAERLESAESKSHCFTPSADKSLCNISMIDSNLTIERDKEEKHNNSSNLIHSDDKFLQKRMDFSPMTEEVLGETSSLLDEIEQIVSRRLNALGGNSSDFSLKKASSIETSTPVRPPRKKKNRKLILDQFRDSYASDTDSLIGDSSFKGSSSSLNLIDDGDQSFKGSNSSLASNQSESSRKPCPPKPPRKKLLKLNRSQSDVSPSKFADRNKENVIQSEEKDMEENHKKVGGKSPNLPPRKGRSLTVDFHVPANQEPLLREIELANERNAINELSNAQKIKPKRKAPPPPPPLVKVTEPKTSNLVREAEYNDIDDDKPRKVSDQDYVEIPEECMDPNFHNAVDENNGQRSNKSPSPPELPPRNLNSGTPVSSPQLAVKCFNPSFTTPNHMVLRDRPMSDVSQNSSLSSQESPMQDELSSTDSEGEDEENKAARKKAKKILCIVKEIASSERVFVDVLKLLNVDFRVHISKATEKAGRPVIPSEVLNRILKYLAQLLNFNEDLLRDLEERVANWENCKKVADIFVRKGPFLKMYTSYITDFEETNKVYDDALKRIPTFQQCVKEFEMSPRCASLGIRHYLLKPIQRIPQYKLLLQDYLKHLSPDSEDYKNTCTALSIVSEVADHANESMRQGDQVQKMLEIQKCLDGHFEVIKPGRVLIKEGELMKLSRKEMQPRMFFLFNDVLLYTTPTPTGGYRLNNVLTLVGMKVTLPASEEYNTEFNIVSVHRSFTVEASSVQERDSWVKALTSAIDDNTQRRNTFEAVRAGNQSFYDKDFVLGSKAPIWIPDARVTMCMLCTCEFSVAWRRHHCRSCGRVICSSCSDNKAPLEYLRNKPARVCNECFQKLVTDFEDKVNTGTVSEGMTEDTDGSFLSLSSLKERFQQIRRSARFTTRVKRPGRLVEVRANDLECSMSGNLRVLKGKKWKKFWFLLKDKVLYKFRASEDVAAMESMPVIGYDVVRFSETFEGIAAHLLFQLSHKNQSPIIFQTDNPSSTDRWMKAMQEAVKG